MASFTFAQVVEPTDSTKVEHDENVSLGETLIIGKGVIISLRVEKLQLLIL